MKTYSKDAIGILLLVYCWVMVGYAQQTKSAPKHGEALKIEGSITQLQLTPAQGQPSLTVKTAADKQYTVHVGPLAELKHQGFNPKVGDKITVAGTFCCEMGQQTMVHSTEIILAGKTFKTPGAAMPGSGGPMQHPGMPGMTGMPCCAEGGAGCCAQGSAAGSANCPGCPQ